MRGERKGEARDEDNRGGEVRPRGRKIKVKSKCGAILYRPHVSAFHWQPCCQATIATEVLKSFTDWLSPGVRICFCCSVPFLGIMRTVWVEVLIQTSDRAVDRTLVLLPWKQDANELPPQFTLRDTSCLEKNLGNLQDLNEPWDSLPILLCELCLNYSRTSMLVHNNSLCWGWTPTSKRRSRREG